MTSPNEPDRNLELVEGLQKLRAKGDPESAWAIRIIEEQYEWIKALEENLGAWQSETVVFWPKVQQ